MSTAVRSARAAHAQSVTFDATRLKADIARRGWNIRMIAVRAGVNGSTVTRFLAGTSQTAPTAQKLAAALGYSVKRYVVWPKAGEASL